MSLITTPSTATTEAAPGKMWSIDDSTPGVENGRFITRPGRSGWLARCPTDALRLAGNPVNEERGTLLVWLLPLEDLATSQRLPQHHQHLPHSGRYRLLSDRADRNLTAAHFALAWDNWWHPNLLVKFAAGFEPWEIHNEPARAFAGANHFDFHRDHWYCVAITWDHPAGKYHLYVNGYLVGTSDSFSRDFGGRFLREEAAPDLYVGNSVIATSEVAAFSEVLDRSTLRRLYEEGAGRVDAELDRKLNAVHGPSPKPVPFAFQPGPEWEEKFSARFDSVEDLEKLYLQGNAPAVKIANGRLEVRTGGGPIPNHATFAEQQLYMWTEEFFEGDLYVEYDFMPMAHGGLSLLLVQASGMQREDLSRILEVFEAHNIRYFFYAGGNDSQDTADRISKLADSRDYKLRVIGIPKTIDNDLVTTDHCPGYGSVIKYIATTVREMACDNASFGRGDFVSILEVMGRSAGWIAAGAALAKRKDHPNDPPHLIYLPEVAFSPEKLIEDVQRVLRREKYCMIVVGEGLVDADGNYVSTTTTATDAFGHAALGGVADYMKALLEAQTSLKVRTAKLGYVQRAAVHCSSKADNDEAFMAGQAAVRAAVSGETDQMVTLVRGDGDHYTCETGLAPLSEIANGVKPLPREWIHEDGVSMNYQFFRYALPLIQGEVPVPYENGLPVVAHLDMRRVKKVLSPYQTT